MVFQLLFCINFQRSSLVRSQSVCDRRCWWSTDFPVPRFFEIPRFAFRRSVLVVVTFSFFVHRLLQLIFFILLKFWSFISSIAGTFYISLTWYFRRLRPRHDVLAVTRFCSNSCWYLWWLLHRFCVANEWRCGFDSWLRWCFYICRLTLLTSTFPDRYLFRHA